MLSWDKFRRFELLNTRQLHEMAEHWGKYVRLYEMFNRRNTPDQKHAFMMLFFRSQISMRMTTHMSPLIGGYGVWGINQFLSNMVTQPSMTRMAICNLLRGSVGSEQQRRDLFQQSFYSRCMKRYEQKVMCFVLRRLFATIVRLYRL